MVPKRISRASTKCFWVVLVVLCAGVGFQAAAAVYDLNDDSRKLRLNIPDSVSVVRGILVYGNGANGDSTGQATNAQLVAVAESLGFAVLATGRWGNFGYNDPPWTDFEINYFEARIAQLAEMSGHPELVHAPWLPMGHSNGGQMSYGMNAKRPHKVIGFITSKGCCYNYPIPSEAALLTPGMLIAGDRDSNLRRTNIKGLFDNNRPRGALWAWVEEEDSGHEEKASQELKLAFLLECYRLRYPTDQSTLDGPITLKNLNEYDGWLVDQTSWRSGLTKVYPYSEAPGNPRSYGWVPNERVARIYQAFSSYGKAVTAASGSSNVVNQPGTITYSVNLTDVSWAAIEFFEGETKVGEASSEVGSIASVSYPANHGGLYSTHGIVTMQDGSKRATPLRRVFVKGPKPVSPFTRWAEANLPPGKREPGDSLYEDGVTNLLRFALNLGVSRHGVLEKLPKVTLQAVGGQPHLTCAVPINESAVADGVNVMFETSDDLVIWKRAARAETLLSPMVERDGDLVTFEIPAGEGPQFVRVVASDTAE